MRTRTGWGLGSPPPPPQTRKDLVRASAGSQQAHHGGGWNGLFHQNLCDPPLWGQLWGFRSSQVTGSCSRPPWCARPVKSGLVKSALVCLGAPGRPFWKFSSACSKGALLPAHLLPLTFPWVLFPTLPPAPAAGESPNDHG